MKKKMLVMKMTAILMLSVCLQAGATGYSQLVTLSERNAPLEKVFKSIRKQTGYHFFYQDEWLKQAGKVNISVVNASLEQVLDVCFKDQPLTYDIIKKTIVVKRKPEKRTIVEEIAAPPPVELRGVVTDENGNPLQGATVTVKGSGKVTQTNEKGEFYFSDVESDNATLTFSFVGYEQQEISVKSGESVSVSLLPAIDALDQAVVVGYGSVKKSDLTGSVSQVKAEEINAYPSTSVLHALSGRAPGVQVIQSNGAPGGGIRVRIRGTNSIEGSNEPLYVIDGFPIGGGNPTIINNADIESIEILKDASATAIYGSRGANGVVLITTKRGKAGRTRVDIESSFSSQSLIKKLDLMNAKEYATFYNQQAANDNLTPYFTDQEISAFDEGFDWQDLVFQKAPMRTIVANVSGGNDKTQFSVSGSTYEQKGIIKGSDYNRYSLRTNINHNISRKFSVSLSSTLSHLKTDRRDSEAGSRGNSMISAAISAPPTLTPYNDDGSYRVLATAYPFVATDIISPLNFINEQNTRIRANRVLVNGAVVYNPIPEIAIRISGGIENADDRTDSYTTLNFVNSQGRASVTSSQFTSLLSENTISYNKEFNNIHSLSAVVGFTYQDFLNTNVSGSGSGFLSDITESANLEAAAAPGIPGTGYAKSVLLSYLARVNYILHDKYLATVSLRRDGSSRYSEGNKWGYFPSAALAWRVSNEEFFRDISFISDLKIRTGWGYTGSQAISPYATLNQLTSGKTVFGDALYNTFAPGTVLPGNLKWETTEQMDIGADIGFLQNRIVLTADYYIKNTRDLLNTVLLPTSLGFVRTIQNIGQVQNRGFEFGVDGKVLTGDFKWDVNANMSFNRNKVVKLYDGEEILGGRFNVVVINDNANILREGQPIGQFWGYAEDGYTDDGKIKYLDVDKDGAFTTKDKTYIGNPNPDFIYGLNSSMSYKNFDLTIFIQGTQGNDLFNISSIPNTIDYGFGLNMPKEVYYNHWTPDNTTAKYPKISRNIAANISDRYVEDGSYLRLKNIALAYNLPVKNMGWKWAESFQVYVSAQNLLTITDYSWWDPEVNAKGDAFGFDHYGYPTSKSVTFGFRAGF